MNDLRRAAELALEALEWNYGTDLENIENCTAWLDKLNATIPALRQALAQPEQEPLGSEWVPCVKLPVIVHVRNQRDGETHISTREGITPALPDDLIMRGVAGEEYPIGRELFERTYTFDVDDVNMSEERVHKTDKSIHEPVCFLRETSWSYEIAKWDDPNGFPVYAAPPQRKTLAELLASTPVDETAKGEHEQKTPLKVLNLTVFTENRLRNGRVYDVETLQGMTNRDILAIPDIGKKALAEVLEALAKLKEQNRG